MPTRNYRVVATLALASLFCASAGCATSYKDRHEREQYGQAFYLDGAGGGHALSPWAWGVRQGLTTRGFPGDVYTFPWNTGLGATADESAGVDYKRGEARKLAGLIGRYQDEHPGRPVTLIGFSAGTAIAVFALEELPRSHPVDDVVLLGSALSQHYDLTEALRRVRNRFVVYTSPKDAVLTIFVAITGTADREFCGACAAGLRGFDRGGPLTTQKQRHNTGRSNTCSGDRNSPWLGMMAAIQIGFIRDSFMNTWPRSCVHPRRPGGSRTLLPG